MPAENAYQGSLLELNFEVYNAGDADATDIFVRLVAPGEESEVYPSQGLIPELPKGESVSVALFWSATIAGLHEVKIELDPNNAQGDLDTTDNVYTLITKFWNVLINQSSAIFLVPSPPYLLFLSSMRNTASRFELTTLEHRRPFHSISL